MGKLEDLAAKVAAARDRYENLVRQQERRIKQFESPDRGKYGSDEAYKKEFAALDKEITVATKELVLAESALNNFTERRTLDPAEGAKMAKDAVARVDEERERRLRKVAGLPDTPPSGSGAASGGQGAGADGQANPPGDAFNRQVQQQLRKLGVLPSEDRRALAEERNKLLEASRQAESERSLARGREAKGLDDKKGLDSKKSPDEQPIGDL